MPSLIFIPRFKGRADETACTTLRRFLNFVIADAARAGAKTLVRSINHRVHRLQIDVPAAVGHIVGVADFMPELWSPAANFTNSCHNF